MEIDDQVLTDMKAPIQRRLAAFVGLSMCLLFAFVSLGVGYAGVSDLDFLG